MLLVQSERNALLTALTAVVGVVERRHTLPILSNLLLEKKGGKLTLLASAFDSAHSVANRTVAPVTKPLRLCW